MASNASETVDLTRLELDGISLESLRLNGGRPEGGELASEIVDLSRLEAGGPVFGLVRAESPERRAG